MNFAMDSVEAFIAREFHFALIEIVEAEGSTPRERGAAMLVSPAGMLGTIGGGQMELMAIAHARSLLAGVTREMHLDIPLGPAIGQCCGGRVALNFRVSDDALRADVSARLKARLNAQPDVWLFGAGHVGRALADALLLLPVKIMVIETRQNELDLLNAGARCRLVAMPESVVADIPPGSAVVILTHDHALDFMIAAHALARDDLAYVGMIGSRTKRATFKSWARDEQVSNEAIDRLVLPIGSGVPDKRPAVIAALTAAEILKALTAVGR